MYDLQSRSTNMPENLQVFRKFQTRQIRQHGQIKSKTKRKMLSKENDSEEEDTDSRNKGKGANTCVFQ